MITKSKGERMALIKCPECGNSISDKAEKCPHCGLPASYFKDTSDPKAFSADDYKQLPNVLISFDKDYLDLFSADHYITHREEEHLHKTYDRYYSQLKNNIIFQYVCNNATAFRIDVDSLKQFLRRMHDLELSIPAHNQDYVEKTLTRGVPSLGSGGPNRQLPVFERPGIRI